MYKYQWKQPFSEEVKMKKKVTRVRKGVSKKSNRWLEEGNGVLSEEHKCVFESNTQWLDDVIINAPRYLLHRHNGVYGLQATTLGYHLTSES